MNPSLPEPVPTTERILRLGYSPCPNDTFIFYGLAHGLEGVPGRRIVEELHDVETLNTMAMDGILDVTKLSFYAWLRLKDRYRMLNAGAAMGHGCGPILVAPRALDPADITRCRVVLPGRWTTAHLLFRLWRPKAENRIFTTYDKILNTVRSGEADCGVIIHESRFTYREAGFEAVVDLGQWWESETGLPIPLGCIAARRNLPEEVVAGLESAIRRGIRRSMRDPESCLPYIRRHAREMDVQVLEQHIGAFVNEYSLELGEAGKAAVRALEDRALREGIIQ